MEQRFPEQGLYNVSAAWRLPWNVSFPALRRAAERLSARHPAWRTTFSEQDGVLFQIVHDYLLPDFREVHVTDTIGKDFETILSVEASRPLSLEQGPLVRWILFFSERYRPILLLVVHHMVVDGWSISALLSDLGKLYGEEMGGSVDLPVPTRSYAEFIEEQSRWQGSSDGKREKAFWKETLSRNVPLLDLPTDRPRRSKPSFDSDYVMFAIPPVLQEKVRKFAKYAGVRPLAVWLAVWFVLLYRLSGQETLVTKIPIAGRGRAYDGVLGFFVNTLPICVRCSSSDRFRTFLRHTANTLEAALVHRDWPFSLMTRDVNRNTLPALLQNTVSWQNYNNFGAPSLLVTKFEEVGDIWHVGDMAWELVRLPQQRNETDIQLQLINLPDNQYGALQYASDLFDRSTIERWSGYFIRLLEGIVAEPEMPIAKLPLLTDAERQRILVEWSNTKVSCPANKCIHELFEAQVAKAPDTVAIIFENQKISYGELNARSNRLAHRLRALGVGSEILVGLFVERSMEMIVGLLAILKAGGAYVPLDSDYPTERLAFMAEDANFSMLLCHGATRDRLPKCTARILDIDAEAAVIAEENADNPPRFTAPDNLMYVIYTSGSTGKPKGVMIEHRMVASHVLSMIDLYGLTPEDRILQFASLNFDASVGQVFGTLAVGATLVVRGVKVWTPEECLHNILHHGVTVARMTPSYVQQLLSTAIAHRQALQVSNFRLLNVGGEMLPQIIVRYWREIALDNRRLLNTYGPTETTVSVTAFEVPEDWQENAASIPIGRPLPGRVLYILDSHLQPVPIGVGGELYIGGAGVGRGYLNYPEFTTDKFIPDPFQSDPKVRLYRSGDSCRWLPDGTIEFLGRIDTQVKIRGFRIECGEVENTLLSEPSVHKAVVDVRGEGVDKRLVAWIVVVDSYRILQPGLRAYLRAHLRTRLPDWMVPSVFMFVDALPLMPSGKIDRRALPAPDASEFESEIKYIAPRDPIEETLCGIFAQVLDVERVGIHDDFFELGGHSLLAIRIVFLIREHLGIDLPLRALFQHPTPAGLADTIPQRRKWISTLLFPLGGKENTSIPPLFCVHPVGGGTVCYRKLADYLGEDWPVYGIQAVGFEGNDAPLTDIDTMAGRYVEEITALWPNGPYNLYGWSFGGVVVFRMAQLLQAMGREVALLALADTAHPSHFEGVKALGEDEIMLRLLAEAGDVKPTSFNEFKKMTPTARQTYLQQRIATNSNLSGFGEMKRFVRIYRANLQALATYRPTSWVGKLVFIAAQEPFSIDEAPLDLRWRDLASQVEYHVVSGNHFTMHRQLNVRDIGEILKNIVN
uniref:Amino acid adenylation domain-containing protein n=1 Tax=Candidatus Kentrum sp. TUN TaxID=2126343 RepID=A0A450ZQY9_9GAMM|nr:MAG: amino acid adenylation domain-containing protein [Candidatus Kentron sp. TUN]VFK62342.1 MAG: amino acid adenylation domain-containing protein [Candidatus Kentron sp. TUN]